MYRTIDPLISASRGTLAGDRPLPRSTRSRAKN